MEERLTLKALFESNQNQLAEKLSQFVLPKDAASVQNTVQVYLNELFDGNGEFRQNLTQSEDYILQAAMSLLNAQQAIVSEFSASATSIHSNVTDSKVDEKAAPKQSTGLGKEMFPHAIGATAIGGAVGGLVLGTWGAFFGSIAGTALVLYYATTQQGQPVQKAEPTSKVEEFPTQKLDVQKFVSIIANICESVDTLIATFRAQIERVVDKYESREKPLLEKEYSVLLGSVQLLLGAYYQPSDEKRQKRIESRIDQLAESLENYELDVVKYDDDSKRFFEETISDKVEQTTMILPAITKHGQEVRKGKVFVKA